MTTQDLGKTLFLLFSLGIAGFAFLGNSLIQPQNAHPHPMTLCLSSTLAMFWLVLVLWVCVALRKSCTDCHHTSLPQSFCGMIFGFLLFWSFIAFNLAALGHFSGHHGINPLIPIYLFLSAFLLTTFWFATTPSSSKTESH